MSVAGRRKSGCFWNQTQPWCWDQGLGILKHQAQRSGVKSVPISQLGKLRPPARRARHPQRWHFGVTDTTLFATAHMESPALDPRLEPSLPFPHRLTPAAAPGGPGPPSQTQACDSMRGAWIHGATEDISRARAGPRRRLGVRGTRPARVSRAASRGPLHVRGPRRAEVTGPRAHRSLSAELLRF